MTEMLCRSKDAQETVDVRLPFKDIFLSLQFRGSEVRAPFFPGPTVNHKSRTIHGNRPTGQLRKNENFLNQH